MSVVSAISTPGAVASCDLPQTLHPEGVRVHARAGRDAPRLSRRGADELVARRPQAGATLLGQRVGDEALIPHRARNAPRGAQELRAGIPRAVRDQPVDL